MLLNIIYPNFCLHCRDKIEKNTYLCSCCFALLNESQYKTNAVFEAAGPILSIVNALKKQQLIRLCKMVASFVTVHLIKRWRGPLPDMVVTLPKRFFSKEWDFMFFIALEVAKMIDRPYYRALRYKRVGLLDYDIVLKRVRKSGVVLLLADNRKNKELIKAQNILLSEYDKVIVLSVY
jgi:predicted amidophosphoribosyltransferase